MFFVHRTPFPLVWLSVYYKTRVLSGVLGAKGNDKRFIILSETREKLSSTLPVDGPGVRYGSGGGHSTVRVLIQCNKRFPLPQDVYLRSKD